MDDDEFDRIADLPDNGARQKEVYARFGLAAYHAQVFEINMVHLIAMAMAYTGKTGKRWTRADAIALYDDLYSETGGNLVERLADVLPADQGLLDIWRRAVKERNRLIHHFVRAHDQDQTTTLGMQRIVDDADAARRVFEAADRATTHITHGIYAEVGITEDVIHAQEERLLVDARERDDEDNAPA